MTKKQYIGKVRILQHNIVRMSKEKGLEVPRCADRVNTPNFGYIAPDGEVIDSYEKAWKLIERTLGKTELFNGIN